MLPEVVFMSSNTMLCMQKRDLRGSKEKKKQIVGFDSKMTEFIRTNMAHIGGLQ